MCLNHMLFQFRIQYICLVLCLMCSSFIYWYFTKGDCYIIKDKVAIKIHNSAWKFLFPCKQSLRHAVSQIKRCGAQLWLQISNQVSILCPYLDVISVNCIWFCFGGILVLGCSVLFYCSSWGILSQLPNWLMCW